MEPARKAREGARVGKKHERELAPVVLRIREDAEREPRRYAVDSEVPAGGE